MVRVIRLLTLAFACAVVAGMHPATAGNDDDPAFSNRTIEGSWGFVASGTILPPATPSPTPAVAVGILEFDGAGFCVIADTINIGGASSSRTSDGCEYAVDPDGRGTLEAQFPGEPGPVPLSFVVIDNANALHFIRTDLGVASGLAERQLRKRSDRRDNGGG